MSARVQPRYTLEEYFELERSSEEKYEYFNGEVFCMSGASRNHGEFVAFEPLSSTTRAEMR